MNTHKIDRGRGKQPLYQQIAEALKRDIQLYYKAGDALPSEFELAKTYHVNRHTLRRAVDELVRDGIVMRHHGKGMFVLAPAIDYPIASRTRLTESLEAQGLSTSSRVIKQQVMLARSGVAKSLDLAEGEQVIYLETLRETDAQPFCVCSHFLPLAMFPGLVEGYQHGSLHAYIEQHYAEALTRIESAVTAVIPESDDLELLRMPRQLPVLRVKSINVSKTSGRPLEYVVTRFRGDMAQLVVRP